MNKQEDRELTQKDIALAMRDVLDELFEDISPNLLFDSIACYLAVKFILWSDSLKIISNDPFQQQCDCLIKKVRSCRDEIEKILNLESEDGKTNE